MGHCKTMKTRKWDLGHIHPNLVLLCAYLPLPQSRQQESSSHVAILASPASDTSHPIILKLTACLRPSVSTSLMWQLVNLSPQPWPWDHSSQTFPMDNTSNTSISTPGASLGGPNTWQKMTKWWTLVQSRHILAVLPRLNEPNEFLLPFCRRSI